MNKKNSYVREMARKNGWTMSLSQTKRRLVLRKDGHSVTLNSVRSHEYDTEEEAIRKFMKEARFPADLKEILNNDGLITEEQKTQLVAEVCNLLYTFGYSYQTVYVRKMIDLWDENNKGLIYMLSQSPYYDGNFRIKLPSTWKREMDIDKIRDFITVYLPMVNIFSSRIARKIVNIGSNVVTEELKVCIEEFREEQINRLGDPNNYGKLNLVVGQKISRAFNKLAADAHTNESSYYNRDFAAFADAVNPININRDFYISVHPIDLLTMSFGNSWASCHTIDCCGIRRSGGDTYSGCYSSGTLSYLLDSSSFITFTLMPGVTPYDWFDGNGKINRCMFHISEDKNYLVQGRVYPQSCDGGTDLYKKFREIVQYHISQCTDMPNLWKNKKGTSWASAPIDTYGTHYKDYEHYDDCNVSFRNNRISDRSDLRGAVTIKVGHNPICMNCGSEHYREENIHCYTCGGSNRAECYECGDICDVDDMYEVGGEYYCSHCAFYCEYHQEYEVRNDQTADPVPGYGYDICTYGVERLIDNGELYICENCGKYIDYDIIYANDGCAFCDDDCASRAGYTMVEDEYGDYQWLNSYEYEQWLKTHEAENAETSEENVA